MARTDDAARPGLRERKKAKTRALIQSCAVALFHKQGYEATTIEQIARAAEVSPSTVFHYFPTKPDLVIYDQLDERLRKAIAAQPAELSVVQMLRAALRSAFGSVGSAELTEQREREHLIRTVPEVRGAMLDDLARSFQEVVGFVAERAGRPAGDDAVVALSGAVLGVGLAAWFAGEGDERMERFLDRMDKGMAMLESGFRL